MFVVFVVFWLAGFSWNVEEDWERRSKKTEDWKRNENVWCWVFDSDSLSD